MQARSLKVSQQQGAGGTAAVGPVPQPPRTNKLPPMDAQKNQQTDEILNAILPPRYMVVLSACTRTLCLYVVGQNEIQVKMKIPLSLIMNHWDKKIKEMSIKKL